MAITAIAGMGGIGKTELALQYAIAQLQQGTYLGGICWLRARDQEIATQILSYAQAQLGLVAPDQLNLAGKISYCWRNWAVGEVLVILDDVTDYNAIASYLPPADPRFKVLMTTRLKLGSSVKDFPVKELDEESAIALLASFVGEERIQLQLNDVKALCQRVGNLPLVLELLGRFLARKPDWTVSRLFEQLASKSLAAKALIATESGMTAQLGVAEALELSWQELDELEQALACLLGLFAVAPIPWKLVEQCFSEIDPDELEETRDEGLKDRSLLKRVSESIYQLHQIVNEYFRIKLSQRSDQGQELKESFCRVMVEIAQSIDDTSTIDQIEGVRGAIIHLEEVASQWNKSLSEDDMIWLDPRIGKFYEGQGNYELTLPWYQKCLEQCKLRFGNEHLYVAVSLSNLAALYRNQGRYQEAEPLYRYALQIHEKQASTKFSEYASTLNNLALLYSDWGRYEESRNLHIQALNIRLKLFGSNHLDVSTSLNNIGLLYDDQGCYQESELFYKQALEIRRKLLGKENLYVAQSLKNLASTYRKKGNYHKSEPLYIQALEMRQKLLGREHPDVAASLNGLATLYNVQRLYHKSEPLYVQALEMRRKMLGTEHPDVAISLFNLGTSYQNQGKNTKAKTLYCQAIAIAEVKLGSNHPNTLIMKEYLASLPPTSD
jgi:tetratricopeptide (TPR) repeat protein